MAMEFHAKTILDVSGEGMLKLFLPKIQTLPERFSQRTNEPKWLSISRNQRCLDASLPQSPARHLAFCGHFPLVYKTPLSYTTTVKKQHPTNFRRGHLRSVEEVRKEIKTRYLLVEQINEVIECR